MKYKLFKDLLSEESGGKYSSKKVWGSIIMTLISAAFIMDGLHFYKANENLFNSMLLAGSTLLGLKIIKDMFNKK